MPQSAPKTTETFSCVNCDRVLPVSAREPVKIGAFFDDDDFEIWCAECVEREL